MHLHRCPRCRSTWKNGFCAHAAFSFLKSVRLHWTSRACVCSRLAQPLDAALNQSRNRALPEYSSAADFVANIGSWKVVERLVHRHRRCPESSLGTAEGAQDLPLQILTMAKCVCFLDRIPSHTKSHNTKRHCDHSIYPSIRQIWTQRDA